MILFQGQNYAEGGSFAWLALHFDGTAVVVDDAIGDRQTQPHAFTFFCREERLKNPVQIGRLDAAAIVGHTDHECRPVFRYRRRLGVDGELAAVGHGIDGVQQQVDHHLLELLRIGGEQRQTFVDRHMGLDVLLVEAVGDQCDGLVDYQLDVGVYEVGALRPGELQKLLNDSLAAASLFIDNSQGPIVAVIRRQLAQELLGKAHDDAKRIVEFMRHGRGDLAEGNQTAGSNELLLEFSGLLTQLGLAVAENFFNALSVSEVPRDDGKTDEIPTFVAQR